jgi:hypothetical protein
MHDAKTSLIPVVLVFYVGKHWQFDRNDFPDEPRDPNFFGTRSFQWYAETSTWCAPDADRSEASSTQHHLCVRAAAGQSSGPLRDGYTQSQRGRRCPGFVEKNLDLARLEPCDPASRDNTITL